MGGWPQGREPMAPCMEHAEKRLAVARVLLGMLRDEPLDSVTPAGLASACGISRSTFYRYFSGVEQVPMWYRDYGAELGMNQIGRHYTCREGHLISIRLLAESAPLFGYFFGSPRTQDPAFAYAAAHSHVQAMEGVLAERGVPVGAKASHELEAVAYGSCAAVSSWLRRGMDVSVPDIVDVVVGLYPQDLLEVFDRPCAPRDPSPLLTGFAFAGL